MNTFAHLVFNLLTVERPRIFYPWPSFLRVERAEPLTERLPLAPVVWGALIPDLPMVVFYAVEKLIFRSSDQYIWDTAYFSDHWSNFIDIFNSIPLIALGFAICLWRRSRWGWLLFASMFLHVLGDLPLHHDDGHRHLFPLSDWRFESPVSYWDPNHYGAIVSLIEAIAMFLGCVVLLRSYKSRWGKAAMAVLLALDVLYLFVLLRGDF
ncbi:MAG: hypothetical protein AAGB01_07665 [Cyanobacteria bacterium P01_F01_bin.42]